MWRLRLQIVIILAVSLQIIAAPGPRRPLAKPNCQHQCGDVKIPFPYGIGNECFLDEWYEIVCRQHDRNSAPWLKKMDLEVTEIATPTLSYAWGMINVKLPTNSTCSVDSSSGFDAPLTSKSSPYILSGDGNIFSVVMLQWGVPANSSLAVELYKYPSQAPYQCINYTASAFSEFTRYSNQTLLATCNCNPGYDGNAYLDNGCQDINECEIPSLNHCRHGTCVNREGTYDCLDNRKTLKVVMIGIVVGFGSPLLVLISWWLYKFNKKREKVKLREKFFKQNGGELLQQQLYSTEGNVKECKLFHSKELEKATDNFNEKRKLGQGGQGTVYKGMLSNGKIVAIKKANGINRGKIEQFINEVVVLSQIHHRNIVQLLGCCLETEVPLLVYEFISNGTLYEAIHKHSAEFPVLWDMRLRIASEVAGALSYLHSSTSIPIYHRDVKSTNILLDDKHRAKIADFGASKLVSLDKTHLTTMVQGSFGYLDPEYFQSSKLTDRSDVYSFGVVLVELLTGEKPLSSLRIEEGRGLAADFIRAIDENSLFGIIDPEVIKQGREKDIRAVANIARKCLSLHGKRRPTMKEVALKLEGIKQSERPSNMPHNEEENEHSDNKFASRLYEENGNDTPWMNSLPSMHSHSWTITTSSCASIPCENSAI